ERGAGAYPRHASGRAPSDRSNRAGGRDRLRADARGQHLLRAVVPEEADVRRTDMAKTLLAIGAHYDDCVFGIPGILLQAVRKHYRVAILSVIGDYSNWAPTRGREREFVDGTVQISKEFGVEMRYLRYASHRYDVNLETK